MRNFFLKLITSLFFCLISFLCFSQTTGNLSVTIKNLNGTSSPLPGANGVAKLYNSSYSFLNDTLTNTSGVATLSSQAFAIFNIEAYHRPVSK
jgi:hypothetical protein